MAIQWFPGQANIEVGFWQKIGGVWSLATTKYAYAFGSSSGPTVVRTWTIDETIQLSSSIQAFGVTVESVFGGSNAVVNDLTSVSWTAPGAGSGTRTATPGTKKGKVTVTPQ